jgi:hypothetical protein
MKSFKSYFAEETEIEEAKYDKFGDRIGGRSRASAFRKKELEWELRKEKPRKYTKKEDIEEEAPANATGPAVDMNPTGKPKKMDKRSKYHVEKMYKRNKG